MPDVGVLNLTIKDNSGEAAKGLGKLATKLNGVKSAAEGYDLSNVQQQIASLVAEAKGSEKAVASLGTLFNAISGYYKTFAKIGDVQLNIKPIEQLKSAFDGGIKTGNIGSQLTQLRTALDGEWNTAGASAASNALSVIADGAKSLEGTDLATVASGVSSVASALEEYAIASEHVKSAVGAGSNVPGFESLGNDNAGGMAQGILDKTGEVASAASEMTRSALNAVAETQDSHSDAKKTIELGHDFGGGFVSGIKDKIDVVTSAVNEFVRSALMTATGDASQIAEQISSNMRVAFTTALNHLDLSDAQRSIFQQGVNVYAAFAKGYIQSSQKDKSFTADVLTNTLSRTMGIASEKAFKPLESGNAITEANDKLEQTTSTIQTAKEAVDGINASLQTTNEQAEGIANVSSAVQKTSAEMQNAKEVALDYYESIEAAFKGMRHGRVEENDLMSGWLHGNGSKNEQLYALKTMASQFGMTVDEVKQKVQELREAERALAEQAAAGNGSMQNIVPIDQFVEGYNHASYLKDKISELKTELSEKMSAGSIGKDEIDQMISKINRLTDEYNKLTEAQEDAASSSFSMSKTFGSLKSGIQSMFPTITSLVKRFNSMLKMRAIRYLIRQIAAGFKEGIQNVYEYSKLINSSFAPSMDAAASSIAQMKNSLGAALAPLLQSLIPILQNVISWFINLINYVNQFIALLRGQSTWTRALPQSVSAFEKQEKAAKKTGAALKDLLADWDELNIIQSESGGSGAGKTDEEKDYLSMFEEVGTFDSKIRGIVDFIKDNFDSIKKVAKAIGAAILSWKVATAFAESLSLISWIAGLALIPIEFVLSYNLTKGYLSSGNEMFLLADFLQTLIGAGLMKTILKKVGQGAIGKVSVPLMFIVSAGASILANVTSTDVSALSEKSLKTSLLAALEGGTAAGFLAYLVQGSIGAALAGGAIGLLGTFGVAIGLKADAKISEEGITKENIIAKLESIAALGITGAAIAAKAGGGAAGIAGMSMLFMGLPITTFGISIGLNAIADTVDASGITPDVIRKNFTSAALVGTGLALGTVAVAGGSVAAIVGVAGAAVTLAALFGIEAILSEDHISVKWGNIEATEDQVKAYVEDKVFTVTPDSIIRLIDPLIKAESSAEEGLKATADEVKLSVKKVVLDYNSDEAKEELEKSIFGDAKDGSGGLIGEFKETIKTKQTLIETGLTLVPTKNSDGSYENVTAMIGEGWDILEGHMGDLGKRLSDALLVAYDKNIDEGTRKSAVKTIQELTDMMVSVSEAITQGENWEAAVQELENNINGLTQGSYDKIFDYINEYKEQIKDSYETVYDATTRTIAGQVNAMKQRMDNALKLAGYDETDESYLQAKQEYEAYKAILDARRRGREKAIEDAAQEAMNDDTLEIIREAILSKIEGSANASDFNEAFRNAGIEMNTDGAFDEFFRGLFDENGNAVQGADEKYKAFVSGLIQTMFGQDASTIQKLIDTGIADITDIVPRELMISLAQSLLKEGNRDNQIINDALEKFLTGQFETSGINSVADSASDAAEKIREAYSNALENKMSQSEIDDMIKGWFGIYDNGFVEDIIDEVDAEFKAKFEIEPEVTNTDDIMEIIRNSMQEAMDAGYDDSQMEQLTANMVGIYGSDIVETVLEELEELRRNLDEEGWNTGKLTGKGRLVASAGGVSDVGWSHPATSYVTPTQPTQKTDAEAQADLANGVASGTAKGNEGQNDLINQLISVVRQIAAKDFTININPTSGWGMFNTRSSEAASKVTGDVP